MKTVIIYGSRRGTTEECAKELQKRIPFSELCNIEKDTLDVETLSTYDTVVIGGNALAGKLNRKLLDFVNRNEQTLLTKQLFLFTCSGEELQEEVANLFKNSFSDAIVSHSKLSLSFGGRYDSRKEKFFMRLLLRCMGIKDYDRVSLKSVASFAETVTYVE